LRQGEWIVSVDVSVRNEGDVAVFDVKGRVTIGAANDNLSAALTKQLSEGTRKVLVNLSGVQQLDSSGISTLVRHYVRLERTGGSLKLCGLTGRAHDVLAVTHLLEVIPHYEQEKVALQEFR
jgi:anti-sigma B factor antagonist